MGIILRVCLEGNKLKKREEISGGYMRDEYKKIEEKGNNLINWESMEKDVEKELYVKEKEEEERGWIKYEK